MGKTYTRKTGYEKLHINFEVTAESQVTDKHRLWKQRICHDSANQINTLPLTSAPYFARCSITSRRAANVARWKHVYPKDQKLDEEPHKYQVIKDVHDRATYRHNSLALGLVEDRVSTSAAGHRILLKKTERWAVGRISGCLKHRQCAAPYCRSDPLNPTMRRMQRTSSLFLVDVLRQRGEEGTEKVK